MMKHLFFVFSHNYRAVFATITCLLLLGPSLPAATFKPTPEKMEKMRVSVGRIDAAVGGMLQSKGMAYNPPLNDHMFLRRVYVDVAGVIPSYEQTLAFLSNPSPSKRSNLVHSLLGQPGHVSHLYNHFAEMLRIQSEVPGTVLRTDAFSKWFKDALDKNRPYNRIVYDMMTSNGRISDNPASGYFLRDADMKLDHVAFMTKVFLGKDISCAQCHDDPLDEWTQMDYYALSAYFGELETKTPPPKKAQGKKGRRPNVGFRRDAFIPLIAEARGLDPKNEKDALALKRFSNRYAKASREIYGAQSLKVWEKKGEKLRLPEDYDYEDGKPGEVVKPRVLIGDEYKVWKDLPPRERIARWFSTPKNKWFAMAIANRMWSFYFGRGVVEPLYNIEVSNAENKVLLQTITDVMIDLEFDLKAFSWVLLHTQSYNKLASRAKTPSNKDYFFPGPVLRRMSAEQVWDSLVTLMVKDPLRYRAGEGEEFLKLLNVANIKTPEAAFKRINEFNKFKPEHVLVDATTGKPAFQSGTEKKKGSGSDNQIMMARGKGNKLVLTRASELQQPAPAGHFLRKFGQSERNFVINASTRAGSVPQVMELMNGFATESLTHPNSLIFRKAKSESDPTKQADLVFLSILTRKTTAKERGLLLEELRNGNNEALADLIWALLNTPEFFFIK
tara:strand:+ start:724 stop:2736 length:2013 start_codon:yes stop_codon:yes gene_type:complete